MKFPFTGSKLISCYILFLCGHEEKRKKSQLAPQTLFSSYFFPLIILFWLLYFNLFFQIKTSCQVYECLRILSLTWNILRPIKRKTITTVRLCFPKWQVMVLCCIMVYVVDIYAYFSFKTVSLEDLFSKSIMLTMNLCQYFNSKLPKVLNSNLKFHSKIFKC